MGKTNTKIKILLLTLAVCIILLGACAASTTLQTEIPISTPAPTSRDSLAFVKAGAKELAPRLKEICATTIKATGTIPATGTVLVVDAHTGELKAEDKGVEGRIAELKKEG